MFLPTYVIVVTVVRVVTEVTVVTVVTEVTVVTKKHFSQFFIFFLQKNKNKLRKTQIVMKLQNSNCDETQKLKL